MKQKIHPPAIEVFFKRFDTTLPIPEYKTPGAAAIDVYARTVVEIPAHSVGYVPLNIALQVSSEYWVLLSARSSLHKKGLLLANGIGVGDSDFSGNQDEYVAPLLNFTENPITIERGERIVQVIVLPRPKIKLIEKQTLGSVNRGGFGTTGEI